MTTTDPDATYHRSFHAYLRIRCAAYVLAFDGRVRMGDLRAFVRRHGVDGGSIRNNSRSGSVGSVAGRVLHNCLRELRDENLLVRDGDFYVAPNLADLAAWVADEVDDDYDPPQEDMRQVRRD